MTSTTVTLAASGFFVLVALKFVAGALGGVLKRNLDVTADIELFIAVTLAVIAALFTPSYSEASVGMAIAFFASTLWSAIAVFRTRTLLQMTHGLR